MTKFQSLLRCFGTLAMIVILACSGFSQDQIIENNSNQKSYLFGKEVAQDYYKPTGVALATGVTTFMLVPAGLGTTVLICSRPVKESKIPAKYFQNKDEFFIQGFQNEALKRKRKAAWVGSGVGFGVFITLVVALAISQG
ncbi:MAG: hypothetical protein ABJN36_00150 [Cyclobacteriaceae bacterium]